MPEYDDIQINLDAEVKRVASKDGIDNPKLLDAPITMPRYDYYKASVVQWYRGRDQGYAEGVASIGPALNRRLMVMFVVGVGIGGGAVALFFTLSPH